MHINLFKRRSSQILLLVLANDNALLHCWLARAGDISVSDVTVSYQIRLEFDLTYRICYYDGNKL